MNARTHVMKKLILGVLALPILLQSCKEIVATDISENVPTLILPVANDTVSSNPVHFKWDEMSGATEYHLQIVSPDFSNINEYTVDSIVTDTELYLTLDSNKYELKLTAMNEGYSSLTLGPVDFVVGGAASSNVNNVVLSSPAAGIYFNEDNFPLTFNWQTVSNLSSFEFSLRKGTSYTSPDVRYTLPGIVSTQLQLPGSVQLEDGQYYWGVKAYQSGGTETFVSSRNFYIDTVNPLASVPVSPTSTETAGTITFTWTNPTDPGIVHAPLTLIIEIAEDSGFTVMVDSKQISLNTTTTFNLTSLGTRYWRMKTVDQAGNESAYSATAQFTVN